jgi:hypothetical protein
MISSSACCGPAAAIHLQIARRPNAGCPDDEGEDRILGSMLADQSGEMLRMDRLAAGLSGGSTVGALARLPLPTDASGLAQDQPRADARRRGL